MDGSRTLIRKKRILMALAVMLVVAPSAGCVTGIPAQIGWMIWGLKKPAEYEGLKGERVAFVCYATSAQQPDRAVRMLTNQIHYELENNVKRISMVPKGDVQNYVDPTAMSERRLLEVGRAVEADKLVAVKIHAYSLYEGSTLYNGQIAYTVTVYDMSAGGKQVWTSGRVDIEWPKHSAVPQIDMREENFESQFVNYVGLSISHFFFDTDLVEDYAPEQIVE